MDNLGIGIKTFKENGVKLIFPQFFVKNTLYNFAYLRQRINGRCNSLFSHVTISNIFTKRVWLPISRTGVPTCRIWYVTYTPTAG